MRDQSYRGFETPNGFWYSELTLIDYLNQEPIRGRLLEILTEAIEKPYDTNLYLNYASYHIFESFKYRMVDATGVTVQRVYIPDGVEIFQSWDSLDSEHPEEVLTAAFEKASKDIGYFAKRVSYRLRRLESSH